MKRMKNGWLTFKKRQKSNRGVDSLSLIDGLVLLLSADAFLKRLYVFLTSGLETFKKHALRGSGDEIVDCTGAIVSLSTQN